MILHSKLTVRELAKRFDLKILAGRKGLERKILKSGINRAGFELSGNFVYEKLERVVLLGTKEFDYTRSLPAVDRRVRYENLLNGKPPAIIVSSSFVPDELTQIAKSHSVPVLQSKKMTSSELMATVGSFISEELAEYTTVHGTLINIYGHGVLIQGESGIGKSEAAMGLIKRGHLFVGDDAIEIAKVSGGIIARPNANVRNFLEVRGIGVMNVARMFGIQSIKHTSDLNMIVELVEGKPGDIFERLGVRRQTRKLVDVDLPFYKFPVLPGRNMVDLVESAVVDYKLRKEGYNPGAEFKERLRKNLAKD